MRFIVDIDLDSDDLASNPDALPEMLRNLADRATTRQRAPINLYDANGNHVGSAEYVDGSPLAPDAAFVLLKACKRVRRVLDTGDDGGTGCFHPRDLIHLLDSAMEQATNPA